MPDLAGLDLGELEDRLRAVVRGEVRFDVGSRGTYATDASNYRQVPLGVVLPRDPDDAVAAVGVCHDLGAPLVSRGGGTSLAGQACNVAVVLDWSKYCHAVERIDPEARTAVVEPGLVLDELNARAGEHGLMFGPKPSTHGHCTLGGMIGNNSCGSTAQAYGKTVDAVRRLEILTYGGLRAWVGPTPADELGRVLAGGGPLADLYRALLGIVEEHGDDVRARFPDIPRRVSGYGLDSLLPEHGFDVAKALVGSEGTLVTVLRAEVDLVPVPRHVVTVVLGYDSVEEAADDVPRVNRHRPHVVEGLDQQIVTFEEEKRVETRALRLLPPGDGWLMVQLADDDRAALDRRRRALVDDLGRTARTAVFEQDAEQAELTAAREAGLGATARAPGRPDTWPGWEDSAVPPERFGDYLRDVAALLEECGYSDVSRYGHFGHGCLHMRVPFDLTTAGGITAFREFVHRAAGLAVRYGGSLSGEHGDGQARGALLELQYGERVVEAFRRLKASFDPTNGMNPGKVVDAAALDADLRLGASFAPVLPGRAAFAYPDDDGSFERAVMRCVGVGACRDHDGAVMCPSYRATGEEEHSTRGRSRLLFEMMTNAPDSPVTDGWRSEAVRDALDLCLACKGCKHDCPMEVDMATYKAEFLHHHYAGRLRPVSHYALGWLPLWARLASVAPGAVNAVEHLGPLTRFAQRLAGVAPDRPLPAFPREPFTRSFARRPQRAPAERGDVLLWPDTFTNYLHPEVAVSAVRVLEDAGYRVRLPEGPVCCGLTWISTGQLGVARRVLRRTVATLTPAVRAGTPVVGLEPSCTAVLRADAAELLPHDYDVARLRTATHTLAELLDATPGWEPPHVGGTAVVQPHCHQHAVLGFAADRRVLDRAGVEATVVGGCCGLAGNFGFEAGHLDVSLACADQELLPAVRDAGPDALLVADGFSCRTQLEQTGAPRAAVHLAELLDPAGRKGAPPARRTGRPRRVRHLEAHLPARTAAASNAPWRAS